MKTKFKEGRNMGIFLAVIGSILTAILAGMFNKALNDVTYFEYMGGFLGVISTLKLGEKIMQELPFFSFILGYLGTSAVIYLIFVR